MTICIAVKVHDVLVFATDSASTITTGGDSLVYQHANKTFNLHYQLPVAAMTCGLGNFGNKSISSISKDFRELLSNAGSPYGIDASNYLMEEIATKARSYFFDEIFTIASTMPGHSHQHYFKYFVGGYSSKSENAEVWSFQIVNGVCDPPKLEIAADAISVAWGGQFEAVYRLLIGLATSVGRVLVDLGTTEPKASALVDAIRQQTTTSLVWGPMPTQDAIDLAYFLADTARGYQRFIVGHNTIGGEIDVAAITRHEGFKWVRRKHFYPADLNPNRTSKS